MLPRLVPSPKKARIYLFLSHALLSIAARSAADPRSKSIARAVSPRFLQTGSNALAASSSSQPTTTLSPPSQPTASMPSFQSPVPISGRPCAPRSSNESSTARQQCSYRVSVSSDFSISQYMFCCPYGIFMSARYGICSSKIAASPLTSAYSHAASGRKRRSSLIIVRTPRGSPSAKPSCHQ